VAAEPFDFVVTIGGTKLKLRAEPVEELENLTVYILTAERESGECERCGTEDASLYLINGILRTRCSAHAEGIGLQFDPLKVPRPRENRKRAPEGTPRWFHVQTTRLRDQGLSLGDISKSLGELGHPLGKRQIQRHLAGDCGCEG